MKTIEMKTFEVGLVLSSGLDPLPTPYQWVLMDDFVNAAEAADRQDLVNNPAGQGAGMLRERRPARQIVPELAQGLMQHT